MEYVSRVREILTLMTHEGKHLEIRNAIINLVTAFIEYLTHTHIHTNISIYISMHYLLVPSEISIG